MAWTYDISTNRGKVRFLIGDTDTSDQLLTDAEVDYLLTTGGAVNPAAVLGCEAIAAKYSRLADKEVGDLKLAYSKRASNYLDMATRLDQSGSRILTAYCGGVSQADKEINIEDSDRVKPAMKRGMMENIDTTDVDGDDE